MLASFSVVNWTTLEEAQLTRPRVSFQRSSARSYDRALDVVGRTRTLEVGLINYGLVGLYESRTSLKRSRMLWRLYWVDWLIYALVYVCFHFHGTGNPSRHPAVQDILLFGIPTT